MQRKRQNDALHYFWPIKHGGTTIRAGAALMPGVTAETDLGALILMTSAGADTMGFLKGAFLSTETDTNVAGTAWSLREVEPCAPFATVEAEYDQADTMAVASTSGTTVTITSLEDNIDTSWLYSVTGTQAGKLAFLATSASGSAVSKTATAWDSTTTVIKILRLFHQLAKINSTADKIGTDAAAGSWTVAILNNFGHKGSDRFYLDPTKHDNMTGLNATGLATKFFAELLVRNSGYATTE